jgi:hypothetical protein
MTSSNNTNNTTIITTNNNDTPITPLRNKSVVKPQFWAGYCKVSPQNLPRVSSTRDELHDMLSLPNLEKILDCLGESTRDSYRRRG